MPHHLNDTINFLMAHGYLILFIITSLESYIVNIAAGVLSNLNYFNVYLVIIISILADLIPNIIYYEIGNRSSNYLKNKKIVKNYQEKISKTNLKHLNLKSLSEKHPIKSLIVAKFFGPPTLILIGSIQMDFRKYLKYNIIITIIKTIIFVGLGYFSVDSYLYLNSLLHSR